MKQLILLICLIFGVASQSYAIKAEVVAKEAASSEIQLNHHKKDGLFANVKHFVKQKVNTVKRIVKNMGQIERGLLLILTVLLPPLGMFFYEGEQWTTRCTISTVLWFLFYLPGLIYTLYVILGDK